MHLATFCLVVHIYDPNQEAPVLRRLNSGPCLECNPPSCQRAPPNARPSLNPPPPIRVGFATVTVHGPCRRRSGCGHSGTSVMLRLIGAHKAVYMFNNETCALCRIGRGLAPGEAALDEVERSRRELRLYCGCFRQITDTLTRWSPGG